MMKAPAKITLKNSTKMSLNARFTSIMKSRPPTTMSNVREQAATNRQASEKNRRLARQMENRPTVEAALGHAPAPPATSKASVLDRLGIGSVRGRGRGFKGSVRGRLQIRESFSATSRARGILRGAMRRGRRGMQTEGLSTRGFNAKRLGRGNISRSPGRSFRGGSRGRGGFRGRGGKTDRGGKIAPVNKNKLDSDLESYMSKTRGSMDAELDAYMAKAGEN